MYYTQHVTNMVLPETALGELYCVVTVLCELTLSSVCDVLCCPVGQESGGVDFRTLGNQTAARVLEEVCVCSKAYGILDKTSSFF